MAATIKEVAKLAGVTIGTVSRAFNGYQDIREETKERIYEAAKKLHYTPNIAARNLSAKNPQNIGLIISGLLEGDPLDNSVYLVLQGVFQYASQNHVEVALYAADEEAHRNRSYTRFCAQHSLSGAVLSGMTTDDVYLQELIDSKIPSVTIDVPVEGEDAGWVSVNNEVAAADMMRHLISMGHKRICVVGGKKNAAVHDARIAGVRMALEEAGITLRKEDVLYGDFHRDIAYKQVERYLANGGKCTAFMCFSDIMAMGVMRAVEAAGFSIPNDVSVTGFDGLGFTESLTPPLTTVAQDMRQMGYSSAALLHQMMHGMAKGEHVLLPHRLIVRQSTKELQE